MNLKHRQASKKKNILSIILSVVALVIILVGFGLVLAPNLDLFTKTSNFASSSKFEQVITKVPSSPKPTVPPITDWKTFTDNQFGFEIKYPEPTIERYKNRIPSKQYLDNDITLGYRLTLSPALFSLSKSDYFLMIIKKTSTNIPLIEQWKNSQNVYGSSITCTNNTCIKSISSSSKKFHYSLEESILNGKQALIISGTISDYESNTRPEVFQWIFIQPNNFYTIEIQKGNSEKVSQILSTLQFTK